MSPRWRDSSTTNAAAAESRATMDESHRLLDELPHRPPFRFLTRVQALTPQESGVAVWHVSGAEGFFQGHFPNHPIVPGVLIIEALAQLSGLVGFYRGPLNAEDSGISGAKDKEPQQGKLVQVDVRFDDSVIPPAEITLISQQARVLGALRQFEVSAKCREAIVARGRLTLAIVPGETDAGA